MSLATLSYRKSLLMLVIASGLLGLVLSLPSLSPLSPGVTSANHFRDFNPPILTGMDVTPTPSTGEQLTDATTPPIARISVPGARYGNYSGYHPIDWSPDSKSLVYTWLDGIWVVKTPDLKPVAVAKVPNARLGEVYYSPNGRQITFYGTRPVENLGLDGNFIWNAKANGRRVREYTAQMELAPFLKYINTWLDNRRIAFYLWLGNGVQALHQIDVRTGKVTTLIGKAQPGDLGPSIIGGSYFYSPDRSKIAIQTVGEGLAIVSAADLNNRHWFAGEPFPLHQQFQAWMPDNRHFLYTQWETGEPQLGEFSPDLGLWLGDSDTQKSKKLLDGVVAATPSPNGTQIAFLQQGTKKWDGVRPTELYLNQKKGLVELKVGVLDLKTNTPSILAGAGYKQEEIVERPRYWQIYPPTWSQKDDLITFLGDDSNLWVIAKSGNWSRKITEGLDIAQALWSPDGSRLAFRTRNQFWIIDGPRP